MDQTFLCFLRRCAGRSMHRFDWIETKVNFLEIFVISKVKLRKKDFLKFINLNLM